MIQNDIGFVPFPGSLLVLISLVPRPHPDFISQPWR